jgi:phosphoglycerate kinase
LVADLQEILKMTILKMTDLDLTNKRVMIREDLNVPMKDGKITNNERILRALPTIEKAVAEKAKVIVLSHLGRPTEGEYDEQFSMAPIAKALSDLLHQDVKLIKDWLQGFEVDAGQVVLCENVRFNKGEKKNDTELAKKIASLCDIYVMDAFATSHRAQATTYGALEYAKVACAGPLLMQEVDALSKALTNPERPLMAIVGGAKVSTKFQVLDALSNKVDYLIVGGGIANTFLAATGADVGTSLYEADWIDEAKRLLEKENGAKILLPEDVVVATELSESAHAKIKDVDAVESNEAIYDIGPKTIANYIAKIAETKTIVWNGPVGVFENKLFAKGTEEIGKAIANSHAFSVAGGGDTLAALAEFGIRDKISYVSTAGGAFLEWLEGKKLPAIKILEKRGKSQ